MILPALSVPRTTLPVKLEILMLPSLIVSFSVGLYVPMPTYPLVGSIAILISIAVHDKVPI